MSKVVLVRCESYDYIQVKAAVERGLELLGGPRNFVKSGEKILLKPNLLAADPPEKCTDTHPAVFKAVAEILKQTGAKLTYGDSPGFNKPETAAQKAGIAEAAKALEIELADFINGEEVFFKDGLQNRKFTIARGVLESDGIISLPKLKTHGLTRMTGSVKNQFGCIPGFLKGEYHVKLPDVKDFARMLVDLNSFLKPRLFIMDGIIAMEGNGPRGGTTRKMNILLFSADPIALDAVVCRIIWIDPETVPTIKAGWEAGLGTYLEEEIELLGDNIEGFIIPDFKVRKTSRSTSKGIMRVIGSILVDKPYIIWEKCVKCGVCVKMCPVNPKAVDWHDGVKTNPPSYKYDRCIKCFCCQELCPQNAIELKTPLIRRILEKS